MIVEDARADFTEGGSVDRSIAQLAAQGDALLERVRAARAIYQELLQTAEAEKATRTGKKAISRDVMPFSTGR